MSTKKCMSRDQDRICLRLGHTAEGAAIGKIPSHSSVQACYLCVGSGCGIEGRVFVKAEIHKLRRIALADVGRSVRLLYLFKFKIDFSILMNGPQQISVH